MAASRATLLSTPRSGASPLPGSPGAPPRTVPPRRRPAPSGSRSAPRPAAASASSGAAPPPAAPGTPAAAAAASPAAPAAGTTPAPQGSSAPASPHLTGQSAEQLSGALAALFIYPLALNLVKGGPVQMWGWIKAKFLNKPYTAGVAGTAGAAEAAGGPLFPPPVLPTPSGSQALPLGVLP